MLLYLGESCGVSISSVFTTGEVELIQPAFTRPQCSHAHAVHTAF